MKAKRTPSSTPKLVLTIGGIGLLVLGASYYLYRRFKRKIPKELVITILKGTRKEMYPLLKTTADKINTSSEISQETYLQELSKNVISIPIHHVNPFTYLIDCRCQAKSCSKTPSESFRLRICCKS